MLTIAEAIEEIAFRLGDVPRARHSHVVGFAMQRMAAYLGEDATLWELTGLCHDLDFDATRETPHRHGPLAAEWLEGRPPPEALFAIASHDHRAGLTCGLPICMALKAADALAVIAEGLAAPVLPTQVELGRVFEKRPWLVPLMLENAERLSIPYALLSDILAQSGYVSPA
jgi:predicted hydrolase (HD superfamily)